MCVRFCTTARSDTSKRSNVAVCKDAPVASVATSRIAFLTHWPKRSGSDVHAVSGKRYIDVLRVDVELRGESRCSQACTGGLAPNAYRKPRLQRVHAEPRGA